MPNVQKIIVTFADEFVELCFNTYAIIFLVRVRETYRNKKYFYVGEQS